jgi:hypothetical protein
VTKEIERLLLFIYDADMAEQPSPRLKRIAIPSMIAFFFLIPCCAAESFSYQVISVPGAISTQANDINDSGEIVGQYELPNASGDLGFIYSGGKYTTISIPGAYDTQAFGISNNGTVVGIYEGGVGQSTSLVNGFVYHDGQIAYVPTYALWDINDAGKIIGIADGADCCSAYSVVIDGQHVQTIMVPSRTGTYATGINDSGQIVGIYYYAGVNWSGFIKSGSVYTNVSIDGHTTEPMRINNLGQIVGWYAGSSMTGFFMDGENVSSFSIPGATRTLASGLNDEGMIVGYFTDDSTAFGFVGSLTDVPEPTAWALICVGFSATLVSYCVRFRERLVYGSKPPSGQMQTRRSVG